MTSFARVQSSLVANIIRSGPISGTGMLAFEVKLYLEKHEMIGIKRNRCPKDFENIFGCCIVRKGPKSQNLNIYAMPQAPHFNVSSPVTRWNRKGSVFLSILGIYLKHVYPDVAWLGARMRTEYRVRS